LLPSPSPLLLDRAHPPQYAYVLCGVGSQGTRAGLQMDRSRRDVNVLDARSKSPRLDGLRLKTLLLEYGELGQSMLFGQLVRNRTGVVRTFRSLNCRKESSLAPLAHVHGPMAAA